MSGAKNVLIGVLIASVAVLGYFCYQSRDNSFEINVPNVSIEKH